MSRKKSLRYSEVIEVSNIIPGIKLYNITLRPNGLEYKYCRICRLFFNKYVESLLRCPICNHLLRRPRRARRMKKRIDPSIYGVEVG